jgi:hypothetical protein
VWVLGRGGSSWIQSQVLPVAIQYGSSS